MTSLCLSPTARPTPSSFCFVDQQMTPQALVLQRLPCSAGWPNTLPLARAYLVLSEMTWPPLPSKGTSRACKQADIPSVAHLVPRLCSPDEPASCHTIAWFTIKPLLTIQPSLSSDPLPPPAADAGTDVHRVCRCAYVPPRYVGLFLEQPGPLPPGGV
jgi:hypothetical protein